MMLLSDLGISPAVLMGDVKQDEVKRDQWDARYEEIGQIVAKTLVTDLEANSHLVELHCVIV
jgi:hypothetical protein